MTKIRLTIDLGEWAWRQELRVYLDAADLDVVQRFKKLIPHPSFEAQNKILAQVRAFAAGA